jgi:hypothetical protein
LVSFCTKQAQSPKPQNPCPSSTATSVVFTAQQGAYGTVSGKLSKWLSADATINLFSYNTPTNGSAYISHGVDLTAKVGPVSVGFSWEQTSYDGGLSFQSSPDNFNFYNLQASSDGIAYEFAPPQIGSGFKVTVNNIDQLCTGK